MFDIFYIGENKDLAEQFPFSKKVSSVDEIKPITKMYWLVDLGVTIKDYSIFEFRPEEYDQRYEHIWQNGNLRLVPSKQSEGTKEMDSPVVDKIKWEIFSTEGEGREKSSYNWFWVVDKNVTPLEDFDWSFQPSIFDTVAHVWQKLNPITHRQYDYDGVKLCPKTESSKKRPKYVRQGASEQRPYPIYTLTASDYEKPLQVVYGALRERTDTDMYWVVDAYTQISPDFAFDYYPTQWDRHNIHVFKNEDGEYKNIRLVPTTAFIDKDYSDEDIENNNFANLKVIDVIASLRPLWPKYNWDSTKSQLEQFVEETDSPFFWTVDDDVIVDQTIIDQGFTPRNFRKVHCWQKLNSITNKVHSYGGLRLWPTNADYSYLTASAIKLNRIKNLRYIKAPGSILKQNDIAFISYHEPDAEKNFERLSQHFARIPNFDANLYWIKDVDGIFNAHKEAATQSDTAMFWVVDADAIVLEEFDFSYQPDVYDMDIVHVWASKNPANGLEYGYGGVKLFPTQMVREAASWGLDFTTGLSQRFKSMPSISCTTVFNTSELATWRSAFRECVKLSISQDPDAPSRLASWLTPSKDAAFAEFAKLGAKQGKLFGIQHKQDLEQLNNINNYKWLEERFNKCKSIPLQKPK